MATITKRGDYQWEVQIRRRGYPRQYKTFTTKSDAQAWAATVESEMARGMFISRAIAERTTLGQLVDRYIREVLPHHRGAESEKPHLRAVQRSVLAERYVSTLTGADFAKFRDDRLQGRHGRKVKPATAVRQLQILKRIFAISRQEWNIALPDNPVANIKFPRVNDARTRRLSLEEERFLMAALEPAERASNGTFGPGSHNPFVQLVVRLAIETAMRRGEILGLCWENVDLTRRVAHLPMTKNGSSRDVPLSTSAVRILQRLQEKENGLVFPISADSFKKAWQRAITRAQDAYRRECDVKGEAPKAGFLADLRFHDLRHEATTRLAEKIQSPLELARITGHKDLKMLLRYYNISAEELAKKLG